MTQDSTILLDVGGTFIKCSDGRSVPVDSNGPQEGIVSALKEACFGAGATPDTDLQIRAAVPGPFNYATGQFLMKHKFASLYGEHFADLIGIPRGNCRFAHDVICMLLGEKPTCNTAIIALGTGLGFAMYIDGKILENELGSPKMALYNKPFRDGILEDYASKRGILRLYGRNDLPVKEIGAKAIAGERNAIDAFAQMGSILGESVATMLKEYRIETLLLGGQISKGSQLFIPSIASQFERADLTVDIRTISDFDNATFNGLKCL